MLVAHHVIDILRGRINRPPMLALPTIDAENLGRVAGLIDDAQKFDFGNLMFERREGKVGEYAMPRLTEDERSFWVQGLIPLPFSVCWYEFTLGGYRSGLLIEDVQDGWRARRLDYHPDALVYDGATATAKYVDCGSEFTVDVVADEKFTTYIRDRKGYEAFNSYLKGNSGMTVMLAVYLTIMLHSKTTDRDKAPAPPPKVNKKRVRNGHTPLADHLIVTIVPAKYREASEREAESTHRPPRLHWRRSHLRHYDHHTPLSKWAPLSVHDGKQGWWIAVIARQLVGRADLGEVSHEYRISSAQAEKEPA